jgi:hypothetical protein
VFPRALRDRALEPIALGTYLLWIPELTLNPPALGEHFLQCALVVLQGARQTVALHDVGIALAAEASRWSWQLRQSPGAPLALGCMLERVLIEIRDALQRPCRQRLELRLLVFEALAQSP